MVAATAALLISCGQSSYAPPVQRGTLRSGTSLAMKVYQPLAVGDSWVYTCNHLFKIADRVVGKHHVDGRTVFALSLQIPSSPKKSTTVVQLLANDAHGDTWIYGYMIGGKVRHVTPHEIVASG